MPSCGGQKITCRVTSLLPYGIQENSQVIGLRCRQSQLLSYLTSPLQRLLLSCRFNSNFHSPKRCGQKRVGPSHSSHFPTIHSNTTAHSSAISFSHCLLILSMFNQPLHPEGSSPGCASTGCLLCLYPIFSQDTALMILCQHYWTISQFFLLLPSLI